MEKQTDRGNSERSVVVAACPACGGSDAAAISSASGFPTFIGDTRFVQPPYSVMECRHCGLLYKTASLSQEGLGEYYSLVDYSKWASDELFPTEALVAKILQDAPPGAKALDFDEHRTPSLALRNDP